MSDIEIIIDFHPDGTTTKTVKGIKGKSCKDLPLSKLLDQALGRKLSEQPTDEYYQTTSAATTIKCRS